MQVLHLVNCLFNFQNMASVQSVSPHHLGSKLWLVARNYPAFPSILLDCLRVASSTGSPNSLLVIGKHNTAFDWLQQSAVSQQLLVNRPPNFPRTFCYGWELRIKSCMEQQSLVFNNVVLFLQMWVDKRWPRICTGASIFLSHAFVRYQGCPLLFLLLALSLYFATQIPSYWVVFYSLSGLPWGIFYIQHITPLRVMTASVAASGKPTAAGNQEGWSRYTINSHTNNEIQK